mmetsp:Transcript_9865/g.44934  ORF Transcript_9865/g.44934 Transcript_9865/m.44934 type:complete len:315 (-) Transcript_9865:169-1113(-)
MSSLPHRKGTLNSTSYSSKCTSNLLCVSLINQRVSNRAVPPRGSWRDASVDAARARCERPSFASPHPSAPSSPASCRTSPRRPQPRPPRPPRRPASPRLHRRDRPARQLPGPRVPPRRREPPPPRPAPPAHPRTRAWCVPGVARAGGTRARRCPGDRVERRRRRVREVEREEPLWRLLEMTTLFARHEASWSDHGNGWTPAPGRGAWPPRATRVGRRRVRWARASKREALLHRRPRRKNRRRSTARPRPSRHPSRHPPRRRPTRRPRSHRFPREPHPGPPPGPGSRHAAGERRGASEPRGRGERGTPSAPTRGR